MPIECDTPDTVAQRLQEACARNQAAEIHYSGPQDTTVVGKTRFLELRGDRILVDVPTYQRGTRPIPPERPVEVHFHIGKERYRFASSLDAKKTTTQVNKQTRLRAVGLVIPSRIDSGQRRAHYRINMVEATPFTVCLAPRASQSEHLCRIDTKPWIGTLINLSAGGLSVLVAGETVADLEVGDSIYITMDLPDVENTFLMMGQLRHQMHIDTSNATRLGIAFKPWPGSNYTTDRREIAKLIAIRQRIALKRRT